MISQPPFLPPDPAVERRVRELGETLFARMEAAPVPGIFSKKGAYARVMEWSMKDPAFKTQLFRFVDVLPALPSSAEIVRHLQEYLGDKAVELTPALKAGLAASAFAPGLVAGPVKANVVALAAQFVAGATAADLVQRLHTNAQLGFATTIDLLGETVVSEADGFLQRNLEVLNAAARRAQPAWAAQPADERARIIERAADLMESRRAELNALLILEAGKPWLEADSEVSEAIDFCRSYAAEARRLDRPVVTQAVPGERCVLHHTPRGTGVVIAPWNSPLAILCGMVVAPVVTGNTVVMKPAVQTPVIAHRPMDLSIAAGLPPGVVNLLTGLGEEVGAPLVAPPHTDFIAFTGSRAVGLKIRETAGRTLPGQANLKKVICEIGGKNALIIDRDADLDEAIPATLASAFGFAGQKCSALSRFIVLADIHNDFVARLIAAAAATQVGDPALAGTVVGPMIDAEVREKTGHRFPAGFLRPRRRLRRVPSARCHGPRACKNRTVTSSAARWRARDRSARKNARPTAG